MTRITAILALLVAVPGCQPPALATWRPVMAPNGARALFIECEQSQGECLDAAAQCCPYGYDLLDRDSQAGSVSRTSYNPYLKTATTRSTPVYNGTMLIQCHPSPEKAAATGGPAQPRCPRQGDVFFVDRDQKLHCVPEGEREQAVNAGWVEAGR